MGYSSLSITEITESIQTHDQMKNGSRQKSRIDSRIEWKWKYNIPKPMGHDKGSSRRQMPTYKNWWDLVSIT